MCKFGCSNPVLARAQDLANFSARKEDLPPQVPYKASQHGNSDGKTWENIWDNMGKSLWISMNANFNGKYESKYVELCEHMWTSWKSSVNKSKSSNFSINSHPSFPLSLSMFWWLFFWRFGPWHVQRLSDSSGSSIPKFHFSQRQVAKEGTCLVSGKHM